MPQDAQSRGGRSVPPNRAYPRVWTLFEALIDVYGAAENVAHCLKEIEGKQVELEKRFGRSDYEEPPEFSESRLEPDEVQEANERRAMLAGGQDLSGIEYLLSDDIGTLEAKARLAERFRTGTLDRWRGWALLDRYASLRHELRRAITHTRAATAAAAPDIDPQGAGLERPSTKILRALSEMGGSLPDPAQALPMHHLYEPGLYLRRILEALPSVGRFIDMVRPDAHREATPPPQPIPPIQPVAPTALDDRRGLNAAEHTLILNVGTFLADHPAERAAAAARLEAQINPEAVRKQLESQQITAAERYEAEARTARAQGGIAWAEELERRAQNHRATTIALEPTWLRTAGKLGALAEAFAADGAPLSEMPRDAAFDAMFLVWCGWTKNEDLVALGCPSLAGPDGEVAREHAMSDLREHGGSPNAFGLRRPFEVARRALAELDAAERAARAGAPPLLAVPNPTSPLGTPHANGDAAASEKSEPLPPSLTTSQARVLVTMSLFDGSRLLATKAIIEEMDAASRLSAETVRLAVRYLIEVDLAERPDGERQGARLTPAGRRLAAKIGD
jgi:hypothetical protein